jgi:hypothetical protein
MQPPSSHHTSARSFDDTFPCAMCINASTHITPLLLSSACESRTSVGPCAVHPSQRRAAMSEGGAAKQLHSGFLTKQGKHVKNWKKRWMVLLSDGESKSPHHTKPRIHINPPSSSHLLHTPMPHTSIFEIAILPRRCVAECMVCP